MHFAPMQFLQVKWRGLEYEECTWEMEGDLEDYMHLVQAFLDRDRHGEKNEGGSNTPPSPPLMIHPGLRERPSPTPSVCAGLGISGTGVGHPLSPPAPARTPP